MITFNALLALLFALGFFGLLWPHRVKHRASAALAGYFAKSLWIVWMFTVISYFFPVGHLYAILLYAACIFLVVKPVVNKKSATIRLVDLNNWTLAHSVISIVVVVLVLVVGISLVSGYEFVFRKWDALVSWNRWAIELANRHYDSGTAYPVFVPGVWSFVYNAQGTTGVWLFAKTFVPLSVVIMSAYGVLLFLEHRILFSLLVLASLGFTAYHLNVEISNGYMDAPVTLFIMFGWVLVFDGLESNTEGESREKLKFGLLMLSVAAITKQPGYMSLALAALLLVYLVGTGKLDVGKGLHFLVLLVLPLVLYLVVFYSRDVNMGIAKNIRGLQELSMLAPGGSTPLRTAAASFFNTYGFAGILVTVALGLSSLLARRSIYRITGVAGMVCFVAGFFMYARYFLYDSRNSFWLMALLIISAISAVLYWGRKFRSSGRVEGKRSSFLETLLSDSSRHMREFTMPWPVTVIVILVIVVAALAVSTFALDDEQVVELQARQQAMVGPAAVELIVRHMDKLGENGRIISEWMPLAYSSLLPPGRFVYTVFRENKPDVCIYWREPGNSKTYENICDRHNCARVLAENFPFSLILTRKKHDFIKRKFKGVDGMEIRKLGTLYSFGLYWLKPV